MKKMMQIVVLAFVSNMAWAQNTGIGTKSPTHKLHVKDVSDPIRLEGLGNATSTAGTIVTDANGVLKKRNTDNISAVRVTGDLMLEDDNLYYLIDATEAAKETFDNLNEFNGSTFTASQTGLYQVSFTGRYLQTSSFYTGVVRIDFGDKVAPQEYGTFDMGGINPPRSSLLNKYPLSITKSELVKLTAGQIIQFKMLTYGAPSSIFGISGSYVITVNRVD